MAPKANGCSIRPACDQRILWQAHKARREVDIIAVGVVKRQTLTFQVSELVPIGF
jgi:hypothetical protein